MAKIRSRMDYAREMQDEIQGVVSYAFDRLQSLHDVHLKLHQMGGEVWFGDTLEEHRLKAKFKEKEEKVTNLYKDLDSYTKQQRYAEVYRAFMVELKDEDDETEWGSIFSKYREQILDFKIKMNKTHQDFLSEMSQVFRIVADQKRKEKEHKMMKDTPIEEFVKNEENIRKVLYEKCAAGEITLEEREAALSKLSDYTESATRLTDQVLGAIDDYCEGAITCEELDNILTGYYKENPEQALYFNGTHIDNRYNAMKNEVVGLYEAGAMDLNMAAEQVEYLSTVYDIAIAEHYDCLTEAVDHPMIDLMVSGMDNYFGSIQQFKESADEGSSDLAARLEALDQFVESTWQYFESTGEVEEEMDESVKSAVDSYTTMCTIANGTVIAAYLACIGLILSIPIGKAINMKKGSNLIKAYEDIHPDAVKYTDLDIVKMSASGAGAKYIPEVAKMLSTDMRVSGKCYLAKYKRKPFAIIVRLQQKTSSVSTGDNGYTVQSSDYRFYYKSLCPEAEKDEDFYEAALMLKKFKVCTPEIKSFAKDLKKEYEELKKEAATAEKKKEQEEKLAKSVKDAKVAKESAGIEYDNEQIYSAVRKQLMDKYTAGEITLEMREAALIEARDRLFGDDVENMMEGVLWNLFKKKNDAAAGMRELSGSVQAARAKQRACVKQFHANQAKINELMDQIQNLEVEVGATDGSSNRAKIMDQIKKLRETVNKLTEENRSIQKEIVKINEFATESVDVESLTQEELDTMTEGVLGGIFKKKENQAACTGSESYEKLLSMYRDNRYKIDQAADKIKALQKEASSLKNGKAGKAYDSADTEIKRLRAEVKRLSDANTKIQKQIAKARAVATNESVNVDEMTQEDLDLMMESIFDDIAKKADKLKPKPNAQQAQAKITANEAEIKRLKRLLDDIATMKRQKNIDPATMRQILDKEKKIDKKLAKLKQENTKLSPLSREWGTITEPY